MISQHTYFALACSCFLFFPLLSDQDTEISSVNQQPSAGVPSYFSRPLEYSRSSITFFLKNIYNHGSYPQDYLALNFSHVNQGLSLAPLNPYPRRFMRKVLGLFSLKLYNVCVNPYALDACILGMINSCAPYTDVDQEKEALISSFKETIGSCISDNFDQLRNDPDTTLHELATKLFELTQSTPDKDIAIPDLHYAIDYFLSQAIRLLVWSPDDQIDTWHSMQAIASRLTECAQYNLIDYDMLDKLYWTLIYQYTHFLSIAGHLLDPSFFEAASNSLQSDSDAFWHLEECELYITTKSECLHKGLMQAEATAQLHAEGYLH